MRVTAAVAAFGLIAFGTTGCGSGSSSPGNGSSSRGSITVHGTITFTGDDDAIAHVAPTPDGVEVGAAVEADDGYTCEGTGGYDDMVDGSQVVISSDAGKTLGLGAIVGDGVFTGYDNDGACTMGWVVKGVATTEKFYNIKIGHRDGPKWTLADLKHGPALSLGG